MHTRKDYLDNKCTHSEYYSQFVTAGYKKIVSDKFGAAKLAEWYKEDKYFNNNTALSDWDLIANSMQDVDKKMRELGDYLTLAGAVCVLKEAARIVAEDATK